MQKNLEKQLKGDRQNWNDLQKDLKSDDCSKH